MSWVAVEGVYGGCIKFYEVKLSTFLYYRTVGDLLTFNILTPIGFSANLAILVGYFNFELELTDRSFN